MNTSEILELINSEDAMVALAIKDELEHITEAVDIIRPKKDKKGNRRYTKDDIQKIRYVYHLVKEKGYTLQGAQEVIAGGKKQGFDKVAAVQKLQELKDFLINLKHELHSRSNT